MGQAGGRRGYEGITGMWLFDLKDFLNLSQSLAQTQALVFY